MAQATSIENDVVYGNINGVPLETDTGVLVVSPRNSFEIKRSTNGGANWSNVHTLDDFNLTRLHFIDSRKYIFFGTESGSGNSIASIVRSVDNGLSFQKVLITECSAPWYMIENSQGHLFLSEYSIGLRDTLEKYAYNVWKSTDAGATWVKFYSHPPQSTPGAQDSIRHIHLLAIDKDDTMYISFGETGWGVDGGKTFILNDNGTLGNLITTEGNGMIAFTQTDDNTILFGSDVQPNKIHKYIKETNQLVEVVNLQDTFGILFGTDIFDMAVGKDGVVYALLQGRFDVGLSLSIPSSLVASGDDGKTWVFLKTTGIMDAVKQGIHLTLNRNYPSSRLYVSLSVSPYFSIPDYTRAELRALYTSTLTIRTS